MLIILDRDGVINEDSPNYIKSPEEWHPIPGSLEAIVRLKQAGHIVVVATNQSGVARGYYDLATLETIHKKMQQTLEAMGASLDAIFFCPHGPDDNCNCRKPKPGLFLQIVERFNTDFKNAIAVGDSYRDIQAAQAVNCRAVLVQTGNGREELEKYPELKNIQTFTDLAAVADFIIS